MSKSPHETDVVVGTRVRLRRKELGLSQTDLGGELGITFQQIQKYERGTNRVGASRLQAIAKVLDVPVGYFFPKTDGEETDGMGENAIGLLATTGAVDLLKAYAAITDSTLRKAVLNLARSLSKASSPTQMARN